MNTILRQEFLSGALRKIKTQANRGIWDGLQHDSYFESCSWQIQQYECRVIFTRDTGYHSSGWWKNPDYERCYHLSISFPGGRNKKALEKILDGLFGPDKRKAWVEPPFSPEGKRADVWHYRVFCNAIWEPIVPRGEVYNTHFTERGWKSFSELHAL